MQALRNGEKQKETIMRTHLASGKWRWERIQFVSVLDIDGRAAQGGVQRGGHYRRV